MWRCPMRRGLMVQVEVPGCGLEDLDSLETLANGSA